MEKRGIIEAGITPPEDNIPKPRLEIDSLLTRDGSKQASSEPTLDQLEDHILTRAAKAAQFSTRVENVLAGGWVEEAE